MQRFADAVRQSKPALHIQINNAAQTVRRPAAYYAQLAEREARALNDDLPPGLVVPILHHLARRLPALTPTPASTSARLSQIALVEEDLAALPIRSGEPFLVRPRNSWIVGVGDVSTPELLEVHLVNSVSPLVLINRLLPLLAVSGPAPRYGVKFSAVEGKFQKHSKRLAHPHRNMAKASLNMLTRTSARELMPYGIFMNSVDTGRATNEFPYAKAFRMENDRPFQPPLDEEDGAARVLDPVFESVRTGRPPHGVFFKDYRPAEW